MNTECPCLNASAAKYVATTVQEIVRDCSVYDINSVTIIEIMGRDVSIVSQNPHFIGESIRSIVNAEALPEGSALDVSFDLKPSKVFVFDKNTEERLYFCAK